MMKALTKWLSPTKKYLVTGRAVHLNYSSHSTISRSEDKKCRGEMNESRKCWWRAIINPRTFSTSKAWSLSKPCPAVTNHLIASLLKFSAHIARFQLLIVLIRIIRAINWTIIASKQPKKSIKHLIRFKVFNKRRPSKSLDYPRDQQPPKTARLSSHFRIGPGLQ